MSSSSDSESEAASESEEASTSSYYSDDDESMESSSSDSVDGDQNYFVAKDMLNLGINWQCRCFYFEEPEDAWRGPLCLFI